MPYCDRPKPVEKISDPKSIGDCLTIEETASLLERQLVHSVYEEIAGHFSDTRHKPWPRVAQFIQSLPPDELLLDLGCGNGKYLGLEGGQQPRWELGADYSLNLLKIATARGHSGLRCDLLSVPLRDGVCGGLICIAALHHLASEARRLASIREMARVLRPGARGLVYVWAKDQESGNVKSSYLKQKKGGAKRDEQQESDEASVGEFGLPVHKNRTQFKAQDVLVPWKTKNDEEGSVKEWKRFYHVFESGELEKLIEDTQDLHVVESYYDQGNWCCIFEKSTT